MNRFFTHYFKYFYLTLFVSFISLTAFSQQVRTSYFMENATNRTSLNPAFRPSTGFVTIPFIGSINANFTSSSLALSDILYVHDGDVVTFIDDSVDTQKFLNKLKTNNALTTDFTIDLISAGWYRGNKFWSFGLGFKTNLGFNLPGQLLEFLKVERFDQDVTNIILDGKRYNAKNTGIYGDSYFEAHTGLSLPITDKINVGARVKFIAGVANIDLDYSSLQIKGQLDKWLVESRGKINVAMKGMSLKNKTDKEGEEYISGIKFDGFGFAGYGAGIDVGVEYKVLRNLTVSASLLDFGFIKWNKNNVKSGYSDRTREIDAFTYDGSSAEDLGDQLLEIFMLREVEGKSYTTSLRTTLNIGANYTMNNNIVGFGLLSSTRFFRETAYTELTAAVTATPNSWFTGALSYSFLHSNFKTLGIAFNFHPSFINFFLGADYLMPNFKKGIPQNIQAGNVYFGLSVPISRSKTKNN